MALHDAEQTYKIKLSSGRILGPLKLDRVAALIAKNRLKGTEVGREYPAGEWVTVTQIPAIARLFLQHMGKRLSGQKTRDPLAPGAAGSADDADSSESPDESDSDVPPIDPGFPAALSMPTVMIPQGPTLRGTPHIDDESIPDAPGATEADMGRGDGPSPLGGVGSSTGSGIRPSGPPPTDPASDTPNAAKKEEGTAASPSVVFARSANQTGLAIQFEEHDQNNNRVGAEKRKPMNLSPEKSPSEKPGEEVPAPASPNIEAEATQAEALSIAPEENPEFQGEEIRNSNQLTAFFKRAKSSRKSSVADFEFRPSNIGSAETIIFQHKAKKNSKKKKKNPLVELVKVLVFSWALGSLGYDTFLADAQKPKIPKFEIIRPTLPSYVQGKSDASKSSEVYGQAMRYYVDDTITGYRLAAQKLSQSVSYDVGNVKALAMLASSYLNLIDVSNKNDDYFNVISKLIDMSRAKSIDLPETVIADVEFFLVANRAEAAQNRVIEYTKSHQGKFGIEMFYYLGLTFFAKEDAQAAAGYLSQFPDEKAFSAKIFYLRGQIAEKLADTESALKEYTKAIKFNANHAKSYLKVATIYNKQGRLKDGANYLEFIMNHTDLLAPKELGQAYYLHAQLSELFLKPKIAVGDLERAVKLDPDNHDILLEYYTLLGKEGKDATDVKSLARMYYFMSEGEKLIQQGHYQDALTPLLQARQADDRSPLPLMKIGDMFSYLHDVENAKINYQLASERAPTDIQVWSKYIQALIQSYEWEDAAKAMDKFRQMPVNLSAIDKAAADIYQKQGQFIEAQTYYKKAMARETIDSGVYVAYAKSLMSVKNFKDPPFFFAIALRYDPLNIDAIINTAKCLAETESIDRGIAMLQDEMKHANSAQAELLTGVAELQKQKGDWDGAQKTVDQAMQVDPNFAGPWKIQAEIHLNRENTDKTALDNALLAYRSFSDRNASDPSGYLERYKIFVKKADFEKAKDELSKIFVIYPKYPNLHYYLGILYGVQGNHRAAAEELKQELTNNPTSFQTILAYGKELQELEDPKTALQYFTKAMAINGGSADAKQSAGWANYQLKNFQAAFALLTEASDIDKANPVIFKRIGIVRRDMGDLAGACTAFRKYLEMEPDASDKADFKACL